jgi:hypothetical protein
LAAVTSLSCGQSCRLESCQEAGLSAAGNRERAVLSTKVEDGSSYSGLVPGDNAAIEVSDKLSSAIRPFSSAQVKTYALFVRK